jgi:hypothetical protein
MTPLVKSQVRLTLAGVAAVFVAAGIAHATIPDANGVIHGCYTKSSGTIRVIDDGVTNCKSGETSLTWNVQGVPGPQGATGPTGPQGPAGNTNVITDAVTVPASGPAASDALIVAGLGTVNLSCNATGLAAVSIAGTSAFTVSYAGSGNRSGIGVPGTITLQSSAQVPGGTAWVVNATGSWKVDFMSDSGEVLPGTPGFPCIAAVTVTIL